MLNRNSGHSRVIAVIITLFLLFITLPMATGMADEGGISMGGGGGGGGSSIGSNSVYKYFVEDNTNTTLKAITITSTDLKPGHKLIVSLPEGFSFNVNNWTFHGSTGSDMYYGDSNSNDSTHLVIPYSTDNGLNGATGVNTQDMFRVEYPEAPQKNNEIIITVLGVPATSKSSSFTIYLNNIYIAKDFEGDIFAQCISPPGSAFDNQNILVGHVPTSGVTIKAGNLILRQGESTQFSAFVTGENLGPADKTVTWSVSGGSGTTAIDSTGLLKIDPDETAGILTVKAVSDYNHAWWHSMPVTVLASIGNNNGGSNDNNSGGSVGNRLGPVAVVDNDANGALTPLRVNATDIRTGDELLISLPTGFRFNVSDWNAHQDLNGNVYYGGQNSSTDTYIYLPYDADNGFNGAPRTSPGQSMFRIEYDGTTGDINTIRLTVTGTPSTSKTGSFIIYCNNIYVPASYEGDISIQANSQGSGFPHGSTVVGRVTNGNVFIEYIPIFKITDPLNTTFYLSEDRAGSFKNHTESVKLILPDGFSWQSANHRIRYGDTSHSLFALRTNMSQNELILQVNQKTTATTCLEIKANIVVNDPAKISLGNVRVDTAGASSITSFGAIIISGGGDNFVDNVIISPKSITAAKGGNVQFSAAVNGSTLTQADKTVTWSVSGGSGTTTIDSTGLLKIDPFETANSLTITATSNFATGKSDKAAVFVNNASAVSIPGDANRDGKVTATDVLLIRQYIVGGYNVTIDTSTADVNKDGKVTSMDVLMIRQYIVGGYGIVLQ